MTIPVYRQNLEYDDWEIASVYDSDDCDSLGRSASYESSHSARSQDDAGFQLQGPLYENVRPYVVPPPPSPHQHANYPPVTIARSLCDTSLVPGKRSNNFALPPAPIVPPPGVIFPPEEWVHPPQEMYRPCTTGHVVTASSGIGEDIGLMDPPSSSLLLSPSSPPRAPSPLIRRPSPTKTIGQHAKATASAAGPANTHGHGTPIMPIGPPPRYHELVHPTVSMPMSPRLAEGGCQARAGVAMSPRRSGPHDVPSTYGPESMLRESQTNKEMTGTVRSVGRPGSYGPGDRIELYSPLPPGPIKYEEEHGYGHGGYSGRVSTTARPGRRERRPSMWQRFVRRFTGPSGGVSVGHA